MRGKISCASRPGAANRSHHRRRPAEYLPVRNNPDHAFRRFQPVKKKKATGSHRCGRPFPASAMSLRAVKSFFVETQKNELEAQKNELVGLPQIPEDRRSRFPIQLRRSEEPKPSPRLSRVFQVGILFERKQPRLLAYSPVHFSSAAMSNSVSGKNLARTLPLLNL